MRRLDLLLAGLLVLCALAVVKLHYLGRAYFIELERLDKEARALDEAWEKLRIEQSTWVSPARIESIARTRLGLVPPPADRVQIEPLEAAP